MTRLRKHCMALALLILVVSIAVQMWKIPSANADSDNPHLEASPNIIQAETYDEFNITIRVANVLKNHLLVGVQFELRYDPTSFYVTNIVNGSFLPQWAPYGTVATYYTEEDIGRVVYGEMILPNIETGEYDFTEYPEGEGDIAIITFKPTFLTNIKSGNLQYNITLQPLLGGFFFLDKNGNEIPYDPPVDAQYYYVFSYHTVPTYAEVALKTPYIGNLSATFTWDFGDGTIVSTNATSIRHDFYEPGIYDVQLSMYVYEQNITVTMSRKVVAGTPFNIEIEGGELYFRGEKADFYIMVSTHTGMMNPSEINILLYNEGNVTADLTNNAYKIKTGLYEVTYDIPIKAPPGTYTLLVKAQLYSITETTMKSFQISPSLTGFITNITNGIAEVQSDLKKLNYNLTEINATIVGLIVDSNNGVLAKIDTSVGTLTTKLNQINATIVGLIVDSNNGVLAKIDTSLGEVKVSLDGIQSTATTTLYATSIISAIAVILAAAILIFMRKK